jgi:2-aminobenzoate-CoA ligase
MIVSSGYNIAGPEVEAALLAHELVKECAVIAAPDPERGFVVEAHIVLAKNATRDTAQAKALQDHVKVMLAPFKYPRSIVFTDTLPKTATGKIQRFLLKPQGKA